jgi:hypothetical protein
MSFNKIKELKDELAKLLNQYGGDSSDFGGFSDSIQKLFGVSLVFSKELFDQSLVLNRKR